MRYYRRMSAPRIETHRVGREQQPLAVIDDFAPDPAALRNAAIGAEFGPAGHHYPGLRASLPPEYLPGQLQVIGAALGKLFPWPGRVEVIGASFSIVTTAPADLTIVQRIPHCDAFDAERIALIHYLSADTDGTAFYRHRSTGFETVDQARQPIYFGQLDAEMRHNGPPPAAYIAGDSPLFEQIMAVPARHNRALLYPSFLLHSGSIAPDAMLSPDPARGRLTVTAFLSVRQT